MSSPRLPLSDPRSNLNDEQPFQLVRARNSQNNADRQPDLGEGSRMTDSVEHPLRMRTGRKWKRDGSAIVIGSGCESRLRAAYNHQKRSKCVTGILISKLHPYHHRGH